MHLIENILSLINMRSFSSLWFWIVVAVYWSTVSRVVLGVPHDMIVAARRGDAQARDDLAAMVAIYVRRRLTFVNRAGHWAVAFNMAVLTAVCVLAFVYNIEFAQAVFLLLLPMAIVRMLVLRLCYRIERESLQGDKLYRAMLRNRFWVQMLGVLAIFVTSIWGMLFVMTRSVLGL